MAPARSPENLPHDWCHELRQQLNRQGLPADYVTRLVTELGDHAEDLFQEEAKRMRTDAQEAVREENVRARVRQRMGTPEQVAHQAQRELAPRGFLTRHRVFGFLVLPVLTLVGFWVCGISLVAGLAQSARDAQAMPPLVMQQSWIAIRAILLLSILLPPVVIVLAWGRLCRRSQISARWGWAMAGLMAVLSGISAAQIQFPSADQKGSLFFGLGMSLYPRPEQFAQLLLPLLAGYLVLGPWRIAEWRRRQDLLAG